MPNKKKEKILVTGTAGFIGFHLVQRLLKEGYEVVGIDNINDYYDVSLKYARLNETGICADSKPGYSLLEATSYQLPATSFKNIENSQKLSAENQEPEADKSGNQAIRQSGNSKHLHPAVHKTKNEASIFEYSRLYTSTKNPNYRFVRLTLEDKDLVLELFKREKFDRVVHMAAQAGVRYSLENPWTYLDCNIYGFLSILEACTLYPVTHLVYASSSSVYGLNTKMPLSASDNVDHPISLYAATKKSNELMAHTYSHLHQIPTTGLRFFTVYGPWGRPDMALFIFTKKILAGEPIDVYNYGNMERDFTYIDDIIEGVYRVMQKPPKAQTSRQESVDRSQYNSSLETGIQRSDLPAEASAKAGARIQEATAGNRKLEAGSQKLAANNQAIRQSGNQAIVESTDPSSSPTAPYRLYNIGNSSQVKLMDFIAAIEKATKKKADKLMEPIQPGDVQVTFSDVSGLVKEMDYQPKTPILQGVNRFVEWYLRQAKAKDKVKVKDKVKGKDKDKAKDKKC